MNIILFLVAFSLSMDAFSLALLYGTLNLNKKTIITLSLIVGIYHFIMPLIGYKIGTVILDFIPIKPDLIVFIVLSYIGINMIYSTFKNEDDVNMLTFKDMLLFGFAVSLDSFSVGIGMNAITDNIYIGSLLFALFSFVFTYMGLIMGLKINHIFGKITTIIGGFILIIIGIIYLF